MGNSVPQSNGRVMMEIKQAIPMPLAPGLGFTAPGAMITAESLQDVMKRRNLSRQD